MRNIVRHLPFLTIVLLLVISPGCRTQSAPPPVQHTEPELKYILLDYFGIVFWCDPDFYPIARAGQEEINAAEQFPSIRADQAEFSAILAHLHLANNAEYTDSEKLLIYTEHKRLKYALQLTPAGSVFDFTVRVGDGQGERFEGTITSAGAINIEKRQPSVNTCPICLVRGILIDTPRGQIPVENLHEGMTVWTVDEFGKRAEATVTKTASTFIPGPFIVVRISLEDGRIVSASPGHPTAIGKTLGEYHLGDSLDGSTVVSVENISYTGSATYDILPSGETGLYWANQILMKTTLAKD